MIMSRRVRPPWGSRDKVQDNFPILKISKFDIGLIKMLFYSVAKVEPLFFFCFFLPLVLKMKIWSRGIDYLVKTLSANLDCAFRKSYAVTTRKPITVFNHDIFLCLQFICCAFCSDLKSENMRDFVQSGRKRWRRI